MEGSWTDPSAGFSGLSLRFFSPMAEAGLRKENDPVSHIPAIQSSPASPWCSSSVVLLCRSRDGCVVVPPSSSPDNLEATFGSSDAGGGGGSTFPGTPVVKDAGTLQATASWKTAAGRMRRARQPKAKFYAKGRRSEKRSKLNRRKAKQCKNDGALCRGWQLQPSEEVGDGDVPGIDEAAVHRTMHDST